MRNCTFISFESNRKTGAELAVPPVWGNDPFVLLPTLAVVGRGAVHTSYSRYSVLNVHRGSKGGIVCRIR